MDESLLMQAEEVAERFAGARPGYRLCDFSQVGLPIYRLTLRATVLARKPLPPIDEFVLKALDADVGDVDGVSNLLGLERVVVRSVVAELMRSESVCLLAPEGSRQQRLALTEKGKRALLEAATITPEGASLPLEFDGILRQPISRTIIPAVAPRELKELGYLDIPPHPSKPPTVEDLDELAVQRVIDALGRGVGKRILSIDRIERRQRYYVPGVALIYRSDDGASVQVGFFVDGREMPEHDRVFAETGGVDRLGISRQVLSESSPDAKGFLGEVLDNADEVYEQVSRIHEELRPASAELETALSSVVDEDVGDEGVTVLRRRVEDLERQLNQFEVRQLEVYEHPKILSRAIEEAQERFLVVSPWVRDGVVNRGFLDAFEEMLRRGVETYVAYGIGDRDRPDIDHRADQALLELRKRYANFHLKKLGNTHAKVLVCDARFAVMGSFNWLSFRGDPDRTFRDEAGVLLTLPNEIDSIFMRYAREF